MFVNEWKNSGIQGARALVACLSGFLFGYDTAIVATILPVISETFDLSGAGLGLVVSVALAGALVGSLVGGSYADAHGRKTVIAAADAFFLIGSLFMALAPSVHVILIGRLLVGLAIGASANIVPVYLAEITDDLAERGASIGINVVYITSGQLAAYVVGLLLYPRWRLVLGSAVLPATIQAVVLFCLRTTATPSRSENPSAPGGIKNCFALKQVRAGMKLHVLQQVSGINTVLYYCPTIIAQGWLHPGDEVSSRAILLASIIPVAFNVAGSYLSTRLVDRAGRRPLLLASLAAVVVVMTITSLAFAFNASVTVVVFLLCAFVLSYSIGLGSVPWTFCSEVFDESIRGRANSLCTCTNWCANMVCSQLFAMIRPSLAFASIALSSALVGLSVLSPDQFPETAGLSLQEAAALFSDEL